MSTIAVPGHPEVTVAVRRGARSRRMSLRVSSLDGRATLTCPPGTRPAAARAFVAAQSAWLLDAVGRVPEARDVAPGMTLPVEGTPRQVVPGVGRRARLTEAALEVPVDAPGPAAATALKRLARARLAAAVDRHAGRLGRQATRLTLRDTRSRWGSCSAAGGLNFAWRLVLAPPWVLDYVAAHEVAHLAHMDHSPRFWACVGALYGDHAEARAWLRREGPSLHRWRFG